MFYIVLYSLLPAYQQIKMNIMSSSDFLKNVGGRGGGGEGVNDESSLK